MFEERGRKSSAYRSVRYSTVRKQSYTADVDRLSQYRLAKKKDGLETSTFYNTKTLELKNQNTFRPFNTQKIPYLQSFHSMFSSEKHVKQKKAQTTRHAQLRVNFKNIDENYEKNQTLEFTLLDPFNRPYTYIDKEIKKVQKQLASNHETLKKLRSDLAILKYTTTGSLNSIQQYGIAELKRLKGLIKKDEISQHQIKMRVRRQITELYEYHDNNVKLSDEILERSKGMQRDIFNCEPFQLEVLVGEE